MSNSLLSQQIKNEYTFSKQHTVLTMRDEMEGPMGSYVRQYVDMIYKYFSSKDFTYMVGDEERLWETKKTRYTDMMNMSNDDMLKLAWTIVCHAVSKPMSQMTELIGKFYKGLPHEERLALETAGELVGILNKTPFVEVIYPRDNKEGVLLIKSKVSLSDDVKEYLANQRYVLPSLVPPVKLTTNRCTGYQTIGGSVILSGKHHDMKVNLAHLNRQNAIGLRLDERVPTLVEPKFKEKLETPKERKDRYDAWVKLNKACVNIYAKFVGRVFYLTHKFDERQRTYDVGHEFNSMGDDYRKGCLELAEQEYVEC